jgi:uncharacterized protein (DUF58 family)
MIGRRDRATGAGHPTSRSGLTAAGWAILLGGAASLAAGLGLGYAALTGLGLAAGAAIGLAAAINVLRLRIAIDRAVHPDRVSVGEPVLARLTVTNRGRLPVAGVDAIERLDGEPMRVQVSALAGGGRRVLDVPIPTPRRGLIRIGPMVVEHRDPLGLMRRVLPLTGQAWLWVRPRTHPMRPLPLGLVPDFEGRLADNAPKGSTAFSALREYVPGDDPRQIHWRSTARAGTLMVREHVDTTDPTTTIVLDTRAAVLSADLFEDGVELAASLAAASLRVGHEVALSAPGEDRRAVAEAGGRSILDRLTALGRSADADPAGLARLAERAREGGALVVISGIEPDLVGRLARVRRRFSRVIIFTLGAEPATVRRPGLAVIRAPACLDAVAQWSRLLAGGPT